MINSLGVLHFSVSVCESLMMNELCYRKPGFGVSTLLCICMNIFPFLVILVITFMVTF